MYHHIKATDDIINLQSFRISLFAICRCVLKTRVVLFLSLPMMTYYGTELLNYINVATGWFLSKI